jgi:cysteinyl-tRNA synthetase
MRLYNSLTRKVEDLVPIREGKVTMYTCGPTVYRYVHIGNLRTFLLADLLRRVLEFEGYEVTQVMNITDVGHMTDESSAEAVDKMQLAAGDEGMDPLDIAEKYTKAYREDAAAIGIRPAHRYPRATEHIDDMIELTKALVEGGHAYPAEGGNVYFDVQTFPGYGTLSGNTLDKLQPGHRDLEIAPGKRHHADFSLWKRAGKGRLMKWPSPWGEGFPGWHIECSAMSMRYLGDRFDIHTGGLDLVFPHHEDEIAQSESAVGHQVVGTWVHGGMMRMRGGKMAKSAGNILRIGDLEREGIDPLSFRYLTFQTRYRGEMDFSDDAMHAADQRVKQLRHRMAEWAGAPRPDRLSAPAEELDRRFRAALSDNLDMPTALVLLGEAVSSPDVVDGEKYALLASWDRVLGLDLERNAREGVMLPAEVEALVAERDSARSARDFVRSDGIRRRLIGMGYEVMDTPAGTRVRPRG